MVTISEHPVTVLANGDRLHIHLDSIISHGIKGEDVVRCNRTDSDGNRDCDGTLSVTPRDIEFYLRERGVPLKCEMCDGTSTYMNKGEGVWIPPKYCYKPEYFD